MFYPSILGIFLIPAIAWAEPVVDPELLAEVPAEERLSWAPLELELARIDAELVGARARLGDALGEASAARDEAGAAEEDVAVSEDEEVDKEAAWSRIDIAETRVDLAEDELATAEQTVKVRRAELELAKQQGDPTEISAARQALKGAKKQLTVRRGDLRVAQNEYQDVRQDEGREVVREEEVASTRRGRSAAADIAQVLDERVELARARVAALEAQRDRVSAELERERARAANQHGAALDLTPFEQALAEAREAEVEAADRLTELESSPPDEEQPDLNEL